MEPIWIFDKDEVLAAILGDAPDGCPYYEAVHHEVLNGVNKLEFTIPGDHPVSGLVEKGCIAVIQTIEGDFRAFRVKRHIQGFGEDGTRYRQVYAEDIAVDELNAAPVIDRRPNNPLDALIGALENSLWEIGQVDGGFPEGSTNFYHETAMSCLQKMVETWGGDVRFRITHDGKRITGRYVDFLLPTGTDTGFRVTVGKNLRELEGEEDITALATALYGYGRGEEHEETGGFGRRISFADVEWKVENGDPVDKPLGQEWVGDPEALAVWGFQGGTVHRFDFVIFEDIEDPEELLRLTWEELQRRKAPQVNYRVKIIDLEHTEGRPFEAVRLGYWATVIDDDFQPPLEFKARIIEKITPLNNPENAEIVLGQEIMTLEDAVNRAAREASRAVKMGDSISLLDSTFQTLTDELHSTPGYVYITPTDGLLVTDRPKDQHPTSAIQLKGGMLAIANEWDPSRQDFNWRAFGTGEGFTADVLTSGRLNANLVEITSADLETGIERSVEIYDGSLYTYYQGELMVSIAEYSIRFFDHGLYTDDSAVGRLTGKLALSWHSKADDPEGEFNARGIGLYTMNDLLVLSRTTPEQENALGETFFYYNRGQRRTLITGPRQNDDYEKLWNLLLSAEHSLGDEHFYHGPAVNLYVGKNNNGDHIAGVDIVIGDRQHGGLGRHFTVFENRDTSGNYVRAFGLDSTSAYLHRDYLYFRTPGGSTAQGWIYATNNTIALSKSSTHFIVIDQANNEIRFVIGGQTRFRITTSGGQNVSSSSSSTMKTMASVSDGLGEITDGGTSGEADDAERPVINNMINEGDVNLERTKLQTRRHRDPGTSREHD